jgi:hypothetical protein
MCEQCQALNINGVPTHEQGCPNSWLHPWTGRPYLRECKECGGEFVPRDRYQTCCDEECWAHYFGMEV